MDAYLARKQGQVDAGGDVDAIWSKARRTKSLKAVERTLRAMTGARERCMYCWDSRGVDIEHFWPKTPYPARAFSWPNLLSTCTGCNRHKSKVFPLDAAGNPVLLSPVDVDPWDHLFFESRTGLLTARFHLRPHALVADEDARGRVTLEVIKTLTSDACVEGRLRTFRNLVRGVKAFLASSHSPADIQELEQAVIDNDDYGLAVWFFTKDGQTEAPFSTLKAAHPGVWAGLVARLP